MRFFKLFGNRSTDYLAIFEKALIWIEKNSINHSGICVNSSTPETIYPEVTGYYIPTLLNWGERERAIKFADYLIKIQNDDGSWNAPGSSTPYTFDTGQILKGLISLVDKRPDYKSAIIRGCNWIVAQQRPNGSIATPDYSAWKLPGGQRVPEAIHLYALSPLEDASLLFKEEAGDLYRTCVRKAVAFYTQQADIVDFNTLSHFHAYIVEALIDLGETDCAREAMMGIARVQRANGLIPAYPHVSWTCSTGMFQYAVCWYKLNEIGKGNKAFAYACRLQNRSGGWYGSYGIGANYFPRDEISWAIKYFLDALSWKIQREFDASASIFPTTIDLTDGRYLLIENELHKTGSTKVLDIGCGKGRFIDALKKCNTTIQAYGVDISEEILKSLPEGIQTKQGSILNIPYSDSTFDLCFCVEALEHAIHITAAIKEMVRVTKVGGKIIIIDKNIEKLGIVKLPEWEQWFAANELEKIMVDSGLAVTVHDNVPYEGKDDNLFIGWVGTKL